MTAPQFQKVVCGYWLFDRIYNHSYLNTKCIRKEVLFFVVDNKSLCITYNYIYNNLFLC